MKLARFLPALAVAALVHVAPAEAQPIRIGAVYPLTGGVSYDGITKLNGARLGLIPPKATAERADRILHELVPDGMRTPLHVAFIRLGREICKAPTPRCRQCPLKDLCPTAPRYR